MLARETGLSHRHLEHGYTPNVFNISTNWLAWMKGRQFNITMICFQKFIKRKEKTCESKAKGRPARQLICPCRPSCCFVVCYCYCCCLIKTTCEAKARGWPDRHVLPPVVKRKTPNAEAASLILTQQIQSNFTDSHSIISTARCSSSRNSLRGITHSPITHSTFCI